MFLILEEKEVVKTSDIIGIFDMDKTTLSKRTRNYLNKAQKDKKIIALGTDLPKTFLVKKDKKVVLTKLMTSTIKNRVIKYEK